MLAAPPPLSDRDEVLALLRKWRDESPGTRRDPRRLDIKSIVATPIHRIAITSIGENRGVGVRARSPATRRMASSQAPIDAWQFGELELPDHSKLGTRVEHELTDVPERVSDCERCRGEGKMACGACHGSGVRGSGQQRHVCGACAGTGHTTCVSCTGLGGFVGPAYVWSAIVEGTATRMVRAPGVSDEAALDIDAAFERGLGTVVQRDDAWNGAVGGGVGYRESSQQSQLDDEIRKLAAEVESMTLGRIRGHRLEIRRAAVYTVTLGDGTTFVTWGPPAKVSPSDALEVTGAVLLRTLALLAIGAAIALAAFWLQRL